METYIVTVVAKPGEEDAVAKFYADIEPMLQEADGFISRDIYQSMPGTMMAWVKERFNEKDLEGHKEPPEVHPSGTQFVIIEKWESIDQRMLFTQTKMRDLNRQLFPYLLPEHSHEFYKDISIK